MTTTKRIKLHPRRRPGGSVTRTCFIVKVVIFLLPPPAGRMTADTGRHTTIAAQGFSLGTPQVYSGASATL